MDIISQLQEQVNLIASLAFNTFGTLQRDAPPVRLSPNYPEPPPNPNSNSNSNPNPNPNSDANANSNANANPNVSQQQSDTSNNFSDEPKTASAALVKAAKQFDALVNALPLDEGGEEAQLKRIAELQAENDAIGQELQRQLEAADKELKQVQELFSQASDNCLNMKRPY
ncbi:mediator of RNA polymerase II transcription subunit 21-like [Amaranthus tricolor]|uniref:mediator of RNA polymerase II transcription subunit 21-like n=1 Tax=Amaranthus tricolor TaxID=29722 RepID=UPI00258786CC|nr:mediator of RNA polymerase II transcription subunit 21-like [Amaranthus tricolor]